MSPNLPDFELTPRQRYGQRLRRLREDADLQAKDLGEQIRVGPDLISRYEKGERRLKADVVTAWARATGQTEAQTDELLGLLNEAEQLEGVLRTAAQRASLAQTFRSELFDSAARIRTLAVTEIPFYLQDAEYAAQEVGTTPGASEIVAKRQANRAKVGKPGRYFEILLAESALRFRPCDVTAMRSQLSALHGLIGAPRVEFGIIPFETQLDVPLRSSFNIFDETAVVESYAGAVSLTPKDARRYIELSDQLWDEAVRGESARGYLTAAANALPAS